MMYDMQSILIIYTYKLHDLSTLISAVDLTKTVLIVNPPTIQHILDYVTPKSKYIGFLYCSSPNFPIFSSDLSDEYFSSEFVKLLQQLDKNIIIDLITCNFKHINQLAHFNNQIRYSTDKVGYKSWTLGSDDISSIYFNDHIHNWKYHLGSPITGNDIANISSAIIRQVDNGKIIYRLLSDLTWNSSLPGVEDDTDFIRLGADEVFDGNGNTVTIDISISFEYTGLFEFDSTGVTVTNRPIIRNLIVDFSNTTLSSNAGGIVKSGSQFFELTNCISTGLLALPDTGGLVGSSAGIGSNCLINVCKFNGTIAGQDSGGICGSSAGISDGFCRIQNSFATGEISGTSAGGICGSNAGSGSTGTCEIDTCYSSGIISGFNSGGICGSGTGSDMGTCKINQCYTLGTIMSSAQNAGGICGNFTAGDIGNCIIENCYYIGDILAPAAGGISGSETGLNHGKCIIRNCYVSIPPNATDGGGICGANSSNVIMTGNIASFPFIAVISRIDSIETYLETFRNGMTVMVDSTDVSNNFDFINVPSSIEERLLNLEKYAGYIIDGMILENQDIGLEYDFMFPDPLNLGTTGRTFRLEYLIQVLQAGVFSDPLSGLYLIGNTENIDEITGSVYKQFPPNDRLYTSTAYVSGSIPTTLDSDPDTSTLATSPGLLTINDLPIGARIVSVDIEYYMTASNGGIIDEQRSYIRCNASGGIGEDEIAVPSLGNIYEAPFISESPDKTANASSGGTNLGQFWIGGPNYSDSAYLEAELTIPSSFTSNHVIFETGGIGYGVGVFIYDKTGSGDYVLSNINAYNGSADDAIAEVDVTRIPSFLGHTGILGWGYRKVDATGDVWETSLLWNGCIVALSGEIFVNTGGRLGGLDPGGYLAKYGGIVYFLDNLTFTTFPNATSQGTLKLWGNRYISPLNTDLGGTYRYYRKGLRIANNVSITSSGMPITFELHAFRTNQGSGTNTTYNFVENGTWWLTVVYYQDPDSWGTEWQTVSGDLAILNDFTESPWESGTYVINSSTPTFDIIIPPPEVKKIKAGGYHSLAILDNTLGLSFGRNNRGQLGIGNLINQQRPTLMSGINLVNDRNVGKLLGTNSSAIINAEGEILFLHGSNNFGKIGIGPQISFVSEPQLPKAPENQDVDYSGLPTENILFDFQDRRLKRKLEDSSGYTVDFTSGVETGLRPDKGFPLTSNVDNIIRFGDVVALNITAPDGGDPLYLFYDSSDGRMEFRRDSSDDLVLTNNPENAVFKIVSPENDPGGNPLRLGINFALYNMEHKLYLSSVRYGNVLPVIGESEQFYFGPLNCENRSNAKFDLELVIYSKDVLPYEEALFENGILKPYGLKLSPDKYVTMQIHDIKFSSRDFIEGDSYVVRFNTRFDKSLTFELQVAMSTTPQLELSRRHFSSGTLVHARYPVDHPNIKNNHTANFEQKYNFKFNPPIEIIAGGDFWLTGFYKRNGEHTVQINPNLAKPENNNRISDNCGRGNLLTGSPFDITLNTDYILQFGKLTVKSVQCGAGHTLILLQNGVVLSAGLNNFGQLGLGHNNDVSTFTQITGIPEVSEISTGDFHSHILLQNGIDGDIRYNLFAFGQNIHGQLGLGDRENRNVPTLVVLENSQDISIHDTIVTGVSGGGLHTVIRIDASENNMASAGYNIYGQLGYNTPDDTDVLSFTRISQFRYPTGPDTYNSYNSYVVFPDNSWISTGVNHNLSSIDPPDQFWIDRGESVPTKPTYIPISWGRNHNGQLGLGFNDEILNNDPGINRFIPEVILSDASSGEFHRDIISLATGANHSLYVRRTDSSEVVFSFGNNEFGQLGRIVQPTSLFFTRQDEVRIIHPRTSLTDSSGKYGYFTSSPDVTINNNRYPPVSLVSNSDTVSGIQYANGSYTLDRSSIGSGFEAWNAFTKDLYHTFWHSEAFVYDASDGQYIGIQSFGGVSGEWLQINFPEDFILRRFEIYPRRFFADSRAPSTFTIFAFDDSLGSWVNIFSVTDYDQNTELQVSEFEIPGNTLQSANYTIVIERVGNPSSTSTIKSSVQIGEWILYAVDKHRNFEPGINYLFYDTLQNVVDEATESNAWLTRSLSVLGILNVVNQNESGDFQWVQSGRLRTDGPGGNSNSLRYSGTGAYEVWTWWPLSRTDNILRYGDNGQIRLQSGYRSGSGRTIHYASNQSEGTHRLSSGLSPGGGAFAARFTITHASKRIGEPVLRNDEFILVSNNHPSSGGHRMIINIISDTGILNVGVNTNKNVGVHNFTAHRTSELFKVNLSLMKVENKINLDVFGSGHNSLRAGLIDSTNTFTYYGTRLDPAKIIKFNLSTFKISETLTTSFRYIETGFIANDDSTGFFSTFEGQMVRIGLNPLTEIDLINLDSSGGGNPTDSFIHPDGNLGYVVTNKGDLIEVNLDISNFTVTRAFNFGVNIGSGTINSAGDTAYLGTNDIYANIIIFNVNNFTITQQISTGHSFFTTSLIDPPSDERFVFFGTNTAPAIVVRMAISDNSVDSVQLETGENYLLSSDNHPQGTFLYMGGNIGSRMIRIGIQANPDRPVAIVNFEDTTFVRAGHSHSMLVENETAYTFGLNNRGQLGLGDQIDRPLPTEITSFDVLGSEASIYLGSNYSTFITTTQNLYLWGDNINGQLGTPSPPELFLSPDQPDEFHAELASLRLETVQIENSFQVALGEFHGLVILSGKLYVFGMNNFGQLGTDDAQYVGSLKLNRQIDNISKVAAGWFHSLLLLDNGQIWSFGLNNFGQLGLGDTRNRYQPVKVPITNTAIDISAGGYHSLILLQDGTLLTFGYNKYGQLGLGHTDNILEPEIVTPPSEATIVEISAGGFHTHIIDSSENLYASGLNNFGQLGTGDFRNRTDFVPIQVLGNIIQVSSGGWHTLTVDTSDNIFSTGYNRFGQLGLGDNIDRKIFTQIVKFTAYDFAAGKYHSGLIDVDGGLYMFGFNNTGQLSLGDVFDRNLPTLVESVNEPSAHETESTFYRINTGSYNSSVGYLVNYQSLPGETSQIAGLALSGFQDYEHIKTENDRTVDVEMTYEWHDNIVNTRHLQKQFANRQRQV